MALATFSSQVTAFVKKAVTGIDVEFRKKVFQLWTDIVDGTPRISGTLRSNWQIGVNTQNANMLDAAPNGATISQAESEVNRLKMKDTGIVYNNIVYAEAVENGISGTARTPRRMVARAIAKAQAMKSVGR